MTRKSLYWVVISLLMLGCSHQTASSASKSATAKPNTPASDLPTDGLVKDGLYTNRFFQFSIQFPRAWKILDSGTLTRGKNDGPAAGFTPPAASSISAGYSLFFAGTVDKQTQYMHGVVISAFEPTAAFAHSATPEKYLRVEADNTKLWAEEYRKKGQTPPLTAGEPTEFHVSGTRMARLDEWGEINRKPARYTKLVANERGFLIEFIFFDSTEDVVNDQAPKEIGSLRFFGRTN